MASANKTPYFNLNLWEPEDQVLRADFNGDNQKVDEALFKQRIVTGSYTGDSNGSAGKTIVLGFTPSVVVVTTKSATARDTPDGTISIAMTNLPGTLLKTTANGFYVEGRLNFYDNYTASHHPYRYIAWR